MGPLLDVPPGVHALRWDGLADRVFVIWSDAVGQSVSVSLPISTTAVRRWSGEEANMTYSGAVPTIPLKETDGPILVVVAQ